MANTHPTQVSFIRAAWLCALLILSPVRFEAAEDADNKKLNSAPPIDRHRSRAATVRHALFGSGCLVFLAGAVGYLSGLGLGSLHCARPGHIGLLQIVGTCLLLWGTLFVRGWDIQTYGGVTLTERVNQWLYRFLYCTGTAVLVSSLSWTQCR